MLLECFSTWTQYWTEHTIVRASFELRHKMIQHKSNLHAPNMYQVGIV